MLTRSPNGGGGAPSPLLLGQHGGSPNGNGMARQQPPVQPVVAVQQQQQQQQPVADYELEYRRIESRQQRNYYKQVFTTERPRYLELYHAANQVVERFNQLEVQLGQLERGTPAWKVSRSGEERHKPNC